MKNHTLILAWLLACCVNLSLQSPTPVLPVVCTAPWVSAAENLLKLLPSSQGPKLCSSILHKYVTTTVTTTLYTSTTTSVSTVKALSTAPTPLSTTTTTDVLTSSLTATTTTTTTTTDLVTLSESTTTFNTVTVTDDEPFRRAKRSATTTAPNVQKLAQLLNVATSVISGFCSCEAPGSTSTATVTSTVSAVSTTATTTTSFTSTTTPPTLVATVSTTTTTSPVVTTQVITSQVVATSTDATVITTVTDVATYSVVPAPTPTFYLKASYPTSDAANANIFGYNNALNGQAFFINFTPNLANAVQFTLDPDTNYVTAVNGPAARDMAFYSTGVGPSSFVLVATESYAAGQGGEPLDCSIDASNNLVCEFGSQTAAFWLCGGHLNVVQPGYDFTNTCNSGTAEQIGVSVAPIT